MSFLRATEAFESELQRIDHWRRVANTHERAIVVWCLADILSNLTNVDIRQAAQLVAEAVAEDEAEMLDGGDGRLIIFCDAWEEAARLPPIVTTKGKA